MGDAHRWNYSRWLHPFRLKLHASYDMWTMDAESVYGVQGLVYFCV